MEDWERTVWFNNTNPNLRKRGNLFPLHKCFILSLFLCFKAKFTKSFVQLLCENSGLQSSKLASSAEWKLMIIGQSAWSYCMGYGFFFFDKPREALDL